MLEYKVKCRHRLGWKEIKLYADTDIEEFFNRNGIEYVRNITDTIEHRQLKEIERLNNIINEALGIANERFNYYSNHKNNNQEHLEDWGNIFNILLRRDNE